MAPESIEHEKRKPAVWLSDEQIELIAEKAAVKAIEKHGEAIAEKAAIKAVSKMTDQFFIGIGRGVFQRFTLILGICAIALYTYAYGKGWVK